MTIRLSVLLAGDTPNTEGMPPEWPVDVLELHDDVTVVMYPRIEMPLLQYEQHRAAYQEMYDRWEIAKELEAHRVVVIDSLWQTAYDYNFQFFSGGAYAQILELKLAGFQRALETQNWILMLWGTTTFAVPRPPRRRR